MQVKLEMRLTAAFSSAKLKLKRLQVSQWVTISDTLQKYSQGSVSVFVGMQMSFLGVERHTGRARNGAWYENNTTILGPNNPWKDKIPSVGEMRQKQSENLITQTATAVFLQLKNDLKSWIS